MLVSACALLDIDPPLESSLDTSIAVPTNSGIHRAAGDEDCLAWGAGDPVEGTLDVTRVGAGAETFVVTDDAQRLYIVWPSGFTATTEAGGTILDDQGTAVFAHGQAISIGQVDRRLHEGTAEDPFVASGILAGSCFLPPPERFGFEDGP
jgi:hypothetical protein